MRQSITVKITSIFIGLVAGTVLLCWLLNTTLLEFYYTAEKQDSLYQLYQNVADHAQKGDLTEEESKRELEGYVQRENIGILLMKADGQILFVAGAPMDNIRFLDVLFVPETTEVVKETEEYTIGRTQDSRLNTEYLVMFSTLSDGNIVIMRTALESIRESVIISNRFLAYVGLIGIIISALIIYFVTKRITNPIRQLEEISKRMTNLDFEAKFIGRGNNEIDALGEHMNQMSETLERTISELKSANNQLLIDIEKKEEIDEMRKDFLSNVSHELKTPLALIQGYAEGLKECVQDDAESRDFYCEVIMDEAGKMNQMVKTLLSLNQIESGNEVIAMERFELTELIQGVINATSILWEPEGIQFIFDEPEPVYVWADEFKTEEVLTNFLSNAIHHAKYKKIIKITIVCTNDTASVRVFNTGDPIPEEDIDQIWIKFYKVDKARTREYGGNGIGLSIVKAILDSFHQKCGVNNYENGVEFWFNLDCRNR